LDRLIERLGGLWTLPIRQSRANGPHHVDAGIERLCTRKHF
jgi:hypothetical protein